MLFIQSSTFITLATGAGIASGSGWESMDPPTDCSEQGYDFGTWCDFEDACGPAYDAAEVFLGEEAQRDGFPCPDGSMPFDLAFTDVHPRSCCDCGGTFCICALPSGSGSGDSGSGFPDSGSGSGGFGSGSGGFGSGSGGMRDLSHLLCEGPNGCDGVFMEHLNECICGSGRIRGFIQEYNDDACQDPKSPWDDFDPTEFETRRRLQDDSGSGSGNGSGGPGSGMGSGSGGLGSGSGMGFPVGPEPFIFPTDACMGESISQSTKITCGGMNEILRTVYSDGDCTTVARTESIRNGQCSEIAREAFELDGWQKTEATYFGGLATMTITHDSMVPNNKLAFCIEVTGLPLGDPSTNPTPTTVECEKPNGMPLKDDEWLVGDSWMTTGLENYSRCMEIKQEYSFTGHIVCHASFAAQNPQSGSFEGDMIYGAYEWDVVKDYILVEWEGADFCGGVGQKCTDGCPNGGLWNADGQCVCGDVLEVFTKRWMLPETCADEKEPETSFHVMDLCIKLGAEKSTYAYCNSKNQLEVAYYENALCETDNAPVDPARRLNSLEFEFAEGDCTFSNGQCDMLPHCPPVAGYDSFETYWVADGICGDGVPTPEPTSYPTMEPTMCMSADAVSFNGHCHVAGDPHIYGFDNAYGTVLRDGDFLLYADDGISVSFRSAIHGGYYNAAGVNAMFVTGASINNHEIEIYAKTDYGTPSLFPTYEVYLDGGRTTMAEMCDEISQYACSCSFVDTAPSWESYGDGEQLSRFSLHVDQDTQITWWGGSVEYGWASIYVDKIQGSPFGATGICTMSAVQGTDPFVDPYPDQMYDCNTSPLHKYRTNYCGDRRRRTSIADAISECQTNEPAKYDAAVLACAPCNGQTGGADSCIFDGCAESLAAAEEMARSCHQVDVAMTPPASRSTLCEDPTPVYSDALGTCVAAWEDQGTQTSTPTNPIITPAPTDAVTPAPTDAVTPAPTDATPAPTEAVTQPVATPGPTDATPAPTNDPIHEEQLLLLQKLVEEVEDLRQQDAARAENEAENEVGSGMENMAAYTSLFTLILMIGVAGFVVHKFACAKPAPAQAQDIEMPSRAAEGRSSSVRAAATQM